MEDYSGCGQAWDALGVRTFKPSETELKPLRLAASQLKEANAAVGIAKKSSDAAKLVLTDWLKTQRKLDIDTLAIGEFVSIEDVVLIEIGKQNKFDEKAFLAAEPATHAKFKKDFPMQKFKPLL